MRNFARIVIAGVRGGSGKTTLSLGLISALRSGKGLRVVPFKKGPDFIDAGWMSLAAENPCYNLDPFLIPSERITDSFLSHSTGDISVIEGNRGLHDGMDAEGSYSTGELSKLLKAPVILIIDCTKMTRTSAAVVLGCMNLDKDVAMKGVVLNQVSGARHEKVVRESIEKYCSIPVLGAFPRLKSGDFPERHMGLTPHQEHEAASDSLTFVRDLAVKYLDLDRILEIARDVKAIEGQGSRVKGQGSEKGEGSLTGPLPLDPGPCQSLDPFVRIGVIRDRAFQFYYPENFEELRKSGAELVEINALSDAGLPGIDALYIGGGFPETNALLLAENEGFRRSVKDAAEAGLPIYAECGGLMFLGEAIIVKGERYPMAGVFPLVFEMREKPQAHGYTIVEADRENPFYPEGTVLRGHEFHYSEVTQAPEEGSYAFRMKRGHGIQAKRDGIFYKNVLAAYTHLHALGAGPWVEGMIRKAREYKEKREARVS